jgi:hypothetical protein
VEQWKMQSPMLLGESRNKVNSVMCSRPIPFPDAAGYVEPRMIWWHASAAALPDSNPYMRVEESFCRLGRILHIQSTIAVSTFKCS